MPRAPFIHRVALRNYKSIGHCDVRVRPLTYLVGQNGAGKSNFLDALHFVRDALFNSLDSAINERGELNEVRRKSSGHPTARICSTIGALTLTRCWLSFPRGETKIAPLDNASGQVMHDHLYSAGELLRMNQLAPSSLSDLRIAGCKMALRRPAPAAFCPIAAAMGRQIRRHRASTPPFRHPRPKPNRS